ncbi:alpha-glucosidase C-terminal domain-containing protein [candidate division KSB1 bacterium]|nr:alpha-glucosidase C-terminal domain-containing protein [candidate division KSB1 bacterium]
MKQIFKIILAIIFLFSCRTSNNQENTFVKTSDEFVPQWAKSVVWYQIFPERFRNGDPTNDPTLADIVGADPQDLPDSWQVHPWGSDWYELQQYEKQNGDIPLWKHLIRRRYGGDLQGIIDKLDYLKELGITAIYLNPVFEAPSHHKYDGASYIHIDPNFGPDPKGDRRLMAQEDPIDPSTWVWTSADKLALKLIREAHARGIRIIFDGVFNHMGINSFAFKDLKEKQRDSRYKDWFIVKSWDDPDNGSKFSYEGWWGVKSLPELREDENGIVKGPRDYIFAATERWMNPDNKGSHYGIDGWRLDVAFCVAHPFWKAWRNHVKSINPEAYLTAEIVDKPEVSLDYLRVDEFDGEMNYNFAFACSEFFFNDGEYRISASEFEQKLRHLRDLFPRGVAYVVQNLFGSHDSNRLASYIVNRKLGRYSDWGAFFNLSKAADNPNYDVRKPDAAERRLQKLFVIFQMTYVGAPMIYYGDEAGMWGANDPDCRKPMIWEDIRYDDEICKPDGSKRSPDTVRVDQELLAHYKKMIKIRDENQVLQTGDYRILLTDDLLEIFVFERSMQDQKIIVVLNNSEKDQSIVIPQLQGSLWIDLLNQQNIDFTQHTNSLTVPCKWGLVLKNKL